MYRCGRKMVEVFLENYENGFMYNIDTETAAGNIFNDWCKFNDCFVVISSSQQFKGEDADQKYCKI